MPHQCTGCGHVFPDGSKEMLSGCPDCGGNKFQFKPSSATGGDGSAAGSEAAASDAVPEDESKGGAAPAPSEEPPEPPEPPSPGGTVAETVAGATRRVKNIVGSSDSGRGSAGADATATESDHEWPDVGREDDASDELPSEDAAQAGARSATVSPEELPEHDGDYQLPEESSAPAATADTAAAADSDDASEPTGSAPVAGSGDREAEETPDLSELRAELNDQFESIKIVERGQYELNLMELYDREEYIVSLLEDGRYAIEVPETWRES